MTTTKSVHQIYQNEVRSSIVNTFSPSSLTQPSVIDFPNLSRGVLHQQHWLNVALSLTITNTTAADASPALTRNPRGMLAWLTNILYKTNSQNTIWALPAYESFMIAMAQASIDMSAAQQQGPGSQGSDPTTYLLNDFTTAQLNTDIAAGGSATYKANARIPINWFGTQTTPQVLGFSTVSPAVTSFQIQMSTGSAANIVANLAAGFTAAISAASIELEEVYYPYNGDPASLPPWYPQLVLAGQLTAAGAGANQQIQLPYGLGEIYKRFFLFARDTTAPFALNTDSLISQVSLVANTTQNLINARTADSLKAEYAYKYGRAISQGMYIHDRLLHGNILDALNTNGYSSLNFLFDVAEAGVLACYAEKLQPNVPLPTSTAKAA
ncbi:MAG: hypothetical protein ACYCXG_11790 [Acidiferrobacter sp.]